MPFRFCIIGAGNIAGKFASAGAMIDGCEIAAVSSKSLARAEAFARANGIERAYGDYESMLKAERPDCAYIATTCDSHARLSALCVDCGVPVLCEKAMFSDERVAGDFFGKAEARGVFSMEALWSLFLPANRQARSWLQSGRIGELVCADFDVGFAPPRDMDNRYFNPTLGGGAANDLTVYAAHTAVGHRADDRGDERQGHRRAFGRGRDGGAAAGPVRGTARDGSRHAGVRARGAHDAVWDEGQDRRAQAAHGADGDSA